MAHRVFGFRRHHQPRSAREAREHYPGFRQCFLQGPAGCRAARRYRIPVFLTKRAKFQQPIHEKPKPAFCGQPPGRGMRRVKQARIFQIGHGIADGGGGQAQRQPARQGARPHGLPRRDIGFHQFAQDLRRTAIQPSGGVQPRHELRGRVGHGFWSRFVIGRVWGLGRARQRVSKPGVPVLTARP